MRVVIIAKTKEASGIWIAGATFEGAQLRFTVPEGEAAGVQIGDVWALEGELLPDSTGEQLPVLQVRGQQPQPPLQNVVAFAAAQLPLSADSEGLRGLADGSPAGPFCWPLGEPLKKEDEGARIVYRAADGAVLPFIGLQEPLPLISAGTLLYISRARDGALQLAGWIQAAVAAPDFDPDQEPIGDVDERAAYPLAEVPPRLQYETPLAALKAVFGYDEFRHLQARIIDNVLQKKDSLVVMPTGSGKSLCYQLPALLQPGVTVVVSPLISLMEDQVSQLHEWGIAAAYLNSSLDHYQQAAVVGDVRDGRLQLLYAAPETLLRPQTMQLLAEVNVNCLTIDEAHCISQWGHDFRPEYQQLALLRASLPNATCLALTATATPRVRQDILQSLRIPAAQEFIASFDRPNLNLQVAPKVDVLSQTLAFLEEHREQSGIIYCATRKQVDTLSSLLSQRGWGVRPYHAGLDNQVRRQNQTTFIRDDTPIIAATIAFGMGINKPDVRFILHVDLPQDIESYYQQIGRAGRDGLQADCLLLYSPADSYTINHFINRMPPELRKGAQLRLGAMIDFAQAGECRRQPLLAYFDEVYGPDSCDLCDNCLQEAGELNDITILAQKFLSCVRRTGEMFGMVYIIDVLRGSRRKAIVQRGHDQLSTYNIGTELSKEQWRHLATQFLQAGLLAQDMQHGGLAVTGKGWAVLRGQEMVAGILPVEVAHKKTVSRTGLREYDRALFQLLREKRKALADEASVPPYVIFPDQTLAEMAGYFPQSEVSFAELYGVGQAKLRKYARPFLAVIREYCAPQGIAEKIRGVETAVASPAAHGAQSVSSRSLLVADQLESGRSVAQIAAEMSIKPNTVLGHLTKLSRAGYVLPLAQLRAASSLPPAEQQRVLAAFASEGSELLRPVYEALAEQISYEELRLMRILFLAEKN